MANRKIYTAFRIFTGENWLPDHAIIVKEGIIESILPLVSLPAKIEIEHFEDCILAPAFIDVQIYGASGKLLSVYPESSSLSALVDYCRKGGAAHCLPTVATNTKEVIFACIDAVREYWKHKGTGVLGLHLEGPWINPEKRGAHAASLIQVPDKAAVKEILECGKDVIRMITLAPELFSKDILDLISSYDIIISAGHSNANYQEAMKGFSNGITAVTHLYNAMSPLHHREPGLVGAAMDDEQAMVSIVPDGYHVDFAAIRIARKILGDRLFVITDAVTETNQGPYRHYLAGDKYEADGILSGSALTMQKALQNLVKKVGIGQDEALRMCSLYPARLLGMDHQFGRVRPGYRADLVVLNNNLEVVRQIFN